MDKQTATQLIGNTFNFPFNEGRFRNFAINLLNNVDEAKRFDYISGTYIRHSFKNHITKYKRLGTYTDPNGDKIDILVVQLKNEWALERSRTMLRNFTSDYLKNRDEKDAALVAYYTTNPDDWRFSYIRMEYKRVQTDSGKFKITQDITPAKRYSFLVGKNEPNHTAQEQLVGILSDDRKNPTLSELENAFSVDAVTKQFYKDYRAQFEKLWNELNDIVEKDPKIAEEFETKTIDTANFAKKLMGQIVFLYFLQKKGWLGVGKDENGNFKDWGKGPKNFLHRLFKKEFTEYGNFFNEVLEPLFYEALATERSNDIFTRFNCKIPFLNGGLFEPINDYNWEETDIRIDNDLIGEVFKTFDQYNFTVREDEPLEKEVAVDPEMLGKVFENLLPENLRKGKGAYYTPRTIVHYMCQESLINYLDTECEPAPKEDIETLIREGDIILELETAIVEEGKKYKSVLMDSIKENAQALDDALANIKVCDPAIGSGAFPVGMLTEIVKTRTVLSLYLSSDSVILNDSEESQTNDGDSSFRSTPFRMTNERSIYQLKRHCIQNSLYGVDIDPGAIEIAKLRLWLSLVVDEDDYTTIQPLPNLDYKIMQGNSLIEEFHGISLDIEKKNEQQGLFSGGSDLDALINDLHQKQDDFFNAEHPREKKQKRDAVETAIYNIFHNELEKKKSISVLEAQEIETDLKEMTHGNKERNFFPWKLYYADVFREKGGFDVVIANPPYDVYQGHRVDEIEIIRQIPTFEISQGGKLNAYKVFLARSIEFQRANGILCEIFQNSFLADSSAKKLRKHFLQNHRVQRIDSFPERDDIYKRVFESAKMSVCILQSKNVKKENYNFDLYVWEDRKMSSFKYAKLGNKDIFNFEPFNLTIPSVNQQDIELLKKVCKNEKLKEYAYCYEGEINLTFHKKHLREKGTGFSKMIKGAGVQKWFTTQKMSQGEVQELDKETYLSENSGKKSRHHKFERIVLQGITGVDEKHRLKMAIIDENIFCGNSVNYVLIENSGISKSYLLGILNSKLLNWYFKVFSTNANVNCYEVNNFPFKIPVIQKPFIKLANQILTAKKANPLIDTTALEAEIDQLVYALYGLTEEEIAIVEESVE